MGQMRVEIVSPHSLELGRGNTVTVQRLGQRFAELGAEVVVRERREGEWERAGKNPPDWLVVLHAIKGAREVLDFRRRWPQGRVAVMFGGTDLYPSLVAGGEETRRALEVAEVLLTYHEAMGEAVPERWREKVRLIPKSLELPEGWEAKVPVREGWPYVVVPAHLRAVKNPFLAVEALARRPDLELEVWQLGEALEEGLAEVARGWERREGRYRWVERASRVETVGCLAGAAASVNSSWSEGGSNAVLESMVLGVPVLASAIAGNRGLLGEDYGAFFPAGSAEGLAGLLGKTALDSLWRARRSEEVRQRSEAFGAEAERRALQALFCGGGG